MSTLQLDQQQLYRQHRLVCPGPPLHQPAASCTDGRGCQALPEQCAAATTTNHTTFICHSHYNLLLLLTRDCSQHPASILYPSHICTYPFQILRFALPFLRR